MEKTLTPESFLKTQGIELKKTTLISYIDGHMRQPDLCTLLDRFHKAKLAELDAKLDPNEAAVFTFRPITASIDGWPGKN